MPLKMQKRLQGVTIVTFYENGGTVTLSDADGQNLPIGLLGTDNKLIVGTDPATQHSIVHLIELFTGHHFVVTRQEAGIVVYTRRA